METLDSLRCFRRKDLRNLGTSLGCRRTRRAGRRSWSIGALWDTAPSPGGSVRPTWGTSRWPWRPTCSSAAQFHLEKNINRAHFNVDSSTQVASPRLGHSLNLHHLTGGEVWTFLWGFFHGQLTDGVDGVDGGDGHSHSGGAEQGDRKFGHVGQHQAEHFAAFQAHARQRATKPSNQLGHLVVRIPTPRQTTFLYGTRPRKC